MATAPDQVLDVAALRAHHRGPVLVPGDPGWDAARTPYNVAVDQRPLAVAAATSPEDVAAAVGFAAAKGVGVRLQGTGHGAVDGLHGVLLVDTGRMAGLSVDPGLRVARVAAGTRWRDVVTAAAGHGLTGLAGTSPTVGVVGYCLGGGLGWLARLHGLAANGVLAADVVTADGRVLRVDSTSEPDLFWALRGGGGSFAAVTGLDIRLFEVPELYAGNLFWPIERAPDVLPAYLDWTRSLPDAATSITRIMRLPPLEMIPEPLRGGAWVEVAAAVVGTEAEGVDLLRPMRDLGPAHLDTFQMMPPPGLAAVHGDPEDPVPVISEHALLEAVPAAAADVILGAVGPGAETTLFAVELRHLGGALAVDAPGGGAVGALGEGFIMFAMGLPMTPELGAAAGAELAALKGALAPWIRPRSLMTFAESPTPAASFFPPGAYPRLQEVRRRYDPHGLFRANHPVG